MDIHFPGTFLCHSSVGLYYAPLEAQLYIMNRLTYLQVPLLADLRV